MTASSCQCMFDSVMIGGAEVEDVLVGFSVRDSA